jgi:tetratricopeptide (TPR) repeat protein
MSLESSRGGATANLASLLCKRYEELGDSADLDSSIDRFHEGLVLLPPEHRLRADCLSNLANALKQRWRKKGVSEDFTAITNLRRDALALTPTPQPSRAGTLSALARHLMESRSSLSQSDEAVALFRETATYHNASLLERFRVSRSWAFSADEVGHESALEAYKTAVELLPQLASLGLDLQVRQDILISRSNRLASSAASCAIRSGDLGQAIRFLEACRSVFWSQASH